MQYILPAVLMAVAAYVSLLKQIIDYKDLQKVDLTVRGYIRLYPIRTQIMFLGVIVGYSLLMHFDLHDPLSAMSMGFSSPSLFDTIGRRSGSIVDKMGKK
jgi:hypothetical protein